MSFLKLSISQTPQVGNPALRTRRDQRAQSCLHPGLASASHSDRSSLSPPMIAGDEPEWPGGDCCGSCPPRCYLQERERSGKMYHYGLLTQRHVAWPGQELENKRDSKRKAILFPRNGEVSSSSQKALE